MKNKYHVKFYDYMDDEWRGFDCAEFKKTGGNTIELLCLAEFEFTFESKEPEYYTVESFVSWKNLETGETGKVEC